VSRWLWSSLLAATTAGLAYWRGALTFHGAAAATAVGTITFARGGPSAAAAMLAFFGSSSVLSRVAESRKSSLPLAQTKGARRDAWQVLANGGIAAGYVAFGRPRGLVGALAAAAADTWATELGLLARSPPRLITTLRRVAPGTSGGVTPEGLLASVAGAAVVGLAHAALGGNASLRRALLAGVSGALIDSLLGATLQAGYCCHRCKLPTEQSVHARCGSRAHLERGLPWVTNDTVNALATLSGALIGLL
jgi:uncharacterized protein (TIGR00297 family)